jgi:hypothetical protein
MHIQGYLAPAKYLAAHVNNVQWVIISCEKKDEGVK